MDMDFIGNRIAQLRDNQGVSARYMSLSLGQGISYINQIENHKALPSVRVLYNICEYLHVSLKDFFDEDMQCPSLVYELVSETKGLDAQSLFHLIGLVKQLKNAK